ncbi:hypothetical protein I3843_01G296600 [Carya illinoinensis]|uniref:Protein DETOXIFICATION n=1 Tax=Carya illinoinensis TaxID=32201 RepID=A0A922GBE0_CARIL|nr:hypothetical protein I3760_01G302700 [Carya illinoinensis]KAG6735147.1 hypothetical protein I3842_01G307400 [Carya illinoinensis]KAG7999200.1 hypothetical protein I3843_01G296600 [Carya illinoinensis]
MQVAEELTSLCKIACPIVVSSLLLYFKTLISMLFLGHIGNSELAGASLSIGFANITGYSVLKGLAMGMEPICCQAYGAKRWEVLCQTYKRTQCLLFLAAIPISLLWLNMEPILLWLGQDRNIMSMAKVYITYSLPDLLAQVLLHPLRIFLRTQSLTKPLTLSAVCAMILHLPINYCLVVYLNMGIRGIALASAWTTLNLYFGLLVYLFQSRTALKPWDGKAKHACSQGWKPLLTLALPSVLSVCLEWWWYEIMLLLCGLLSHPQESVAAMGILIQTTGLLYVFPHSLSLGLSTLVGQELGAGQPARAQQTTVIGLVVAVGCSILAFAFTIAVRNGWGKLFTCETQVLALTSIALPILGFCELGNCPQTAACGILIGSARAKLGACINFGSFYLIGLPVAALMSFTFKMGFVGLWFGLAAAQISCMCMMICALVSTDWKNQVNRARELTQTTEGNGTDLEANLIG